MNKVYLCFKYIGYAIFSILLGWLSSLGGEEKDYVLKVSTIIIPLLLTLIALTTTLTGMIINELQKFKSNFNKDISQVVYELKRNVIIQIGIVAVAFIFLTCKEAIIIYFPCIDAYATIAQNSVIVFAFMYFVLVIADAAMGLYDLIIENNK